MGFEWDERKNKENILKHGISFQTASEIFQGPVLNRLDDRKDYGEPRWVCLGRVESGLLIVVAHTVRNENIRIISARLASQKERRMFEHAERKKHEGSQENEG